MKIYKHHKSKLNNLLEDLSENRKKESFKKHMLLLFILAFICIFQNMRSQDKVRTDILLNFDWKFFIGDDQQASAVNYDDKKWQTVQLPHDGSIAGAFDTISGSRQNGYRPRHIGWYRKSFIIPGNIQNKKIFIEFEGVYRSAEVWINGILLGKHLNGYTGFSYDITKYSKNGQSNTIAVRYDNTYKLSSRWYTGEGIYRNVWIHITQPLHVAENGTYITTPHVSEASAEIAIQTEVVNQSDSSALTTVKTVICSPSGKEIKSTISTVPMAPRESYVFKQEVLVPEPEYWDTESPKMYKAKSYVLNNDRITDEYTTPFGIRSVKFNPEQGFLLNGRKVFLNGVNIHHDLGPLGAAAFEKGIRRRLVGLKQMGCNAIRLAHNPYAKVVLDICDEMGILVFNESFDKWSSEYYGPGEVFDNYWQDDLKWFIKRDRNHPSVFIWSVGNEVFDSKSYRKDTTLVPRLKKMVEFTHAIDPSRKVTSGLYPMREEDKPDPLAFHMDVMSDNYMSRFYKRDHPKFPQLVFLESEMTTDNGGENFFNYDHSYACGQFYWGGTDYIGESFGWPSKGWNGLIDWCDFWKPISYYIKSLYSDEPLVKIAILDTAHSDARVWNDVYMKTLKLNDSWNWKPGKKLSLYTFTTGDEVELFLNGKSLGIKKTKDFPKKKIAWELNFEPGELKAVARKNDKDIAVDKIITADKAYQISLTTDSTHLISNGLDLAYITVTIKDKNGILVHEAENNISFRVEGAGDIAGVANGNRLSDELFVSDNRKVFDGKCLLVIRSRTIPGKIKIRAKSPGLKEASLEINSVLQESK